jgi:hypothetical protein
LSIYIRPSETPIPSQAGFEEWALVNAPPIPEMNALFPIVGFFAGCLCDRAFAATSGPTASVGFAFRCFAKVTAVVAFVFFPNRVAQYCQLSRAARNLTPAYVCAPTGNEGVQRFSKP